MKAITGVLTLCVALALPGAAQAGKAKENEDQPAGKSAGQMLDSKILPPALSLRERKYRNHFLRMRRIPGASFRIHIPRKQRNRE
jgi:hypothetical protein